MSVYEKEAPAFFNLAMQSIWDEQTLKPDEIVLVKDGSLGTELNKAVKSWQEKLSDTLKVIALPQNVGLGDALNEGLKHCTFEWVARMDTDDISHPKRFEKQISFLESHSDIDVVGSWIGEFENDRNKIYTSRNLPCTHQEIVKFAKKRTPLNHMTVIFRKSAVLQAGSYNGFRFLQDYCLWVCMIQCGAKFANLPEQLVSVRGGRMMAQRRGGMYYAIDEYKMQKYFLKIGFLNYAEFLRNEFIRFSVRIIPSRLRAIVYNIFLRQSA
jgi:glycosyltransferase involved in cell wall biosynthesis